MLPNLKKLRQEYGISQQGLANAIGVSQPSINKYENHNIEPDIEVLIRIADFFNTSVDYVVGHTEIRRKIEHMEVFYLNDAETEAVIRYRSLTPDQQACVNQVIRTLLDK